MRTYQDPNDSLSKTVLTYYMIQFVLLGIIAMLAYNLFNR